MNTRPGISKLMAERLHFPPCHGVVVTALLDDGQQMAVPGVWSVKDLEKSVDPSALMETLFINLVDSLNDVIDMKYGMPPYDQETLDKVNR